MRAPLWTPNTNAIVGRQSGAYLGNAYAGEKCLGIATNRYDQQLVTASSRVFAGGGSDYICHIIMLDNLHQVKWSREFGNAAGGSLDLCPDAVISREGFIVYVIGHAYDFTTLAAPAGTTDLYILALKINDGTLMKQRFIIGDKDDQLRAVRFHRNTLYIVGDTNSVF